MSTPAVQLPRRHPVSVQEYLRMGQTGVLDPSARVELIEGELFDMPPIGPHHAGKVNRINQLLSLAVGDAAIVSAQNPLVLGDFSAPQPDIALLRWRDDFYEQAHPGPEDVLVLVEVSDTTLVYDREHKLPLYARFDVPEVWLVDVAGGRLDIHQNPQDGLFTTRFRVGDLANVTIAALPGLHLDLRTLFQAQGKA